MQIVLFFRISIIQSAIKGLPLLSENRDSAVIYVLTLLMLIMLIMFIIVNTHEMYQKKPAIASAY